MTIQGLVSIVIPTFNDEPAHLRDAVASALGQKGPVAVEVVLVDDGSTRPETVAAVDELGAADQVRVVRQANAGASAAIDAGVAASEGEFVVMLGGDDWINEHFVWSCQREMAPDVAFVYSAVNYFWDDGRASRMAEPPRELTLSSFMGGNRVAAPCLVRRADWDGVGGLTTEDLAFEDYDLWVKVLRSRAGARAVLASGAVLHYRQRPGSRSSIAPDAERTRLTRRGLVATDDVELLRRMLTASWDRIDELAAQVAVRDAQLAWDRRTRGIRRLLRRR